MAKRGRPKKIKEEHEIKNGVTIISVPQVVVSEKIIQPSAECEPDIINLTTGEITTKSQEKRDKLNSVLRNLNKTIGKGTVKFADEVEVRQRIPFGNKHIDKMIGSGIPEGTFTTVWGSKGCGKTTAILDLIASAQKLGKQCVYINGERSYDPVYAKKRQVNTESLVVVEVEQLEDGLDAIIKLCREKVVDLIVLDSIHGLATKAELVQGKTEKEKSTADANMALRARALTQFFEMATSYVAEAKCAVVLVAQSRMDLGGFIKLEVLTGGNALMHFSRLILKFRRGQKVDAPTEKRPTGAITESGKEEMESVPVGFDMVIRIDKAQIENCTEGDEIHLPFYFDKGIYNE
jgi:protein RecA